MPIIEARVGAIVVTSVMAASRVTPPVPIAETDQGDADRQPSGHEGAEREEQDEHRDADADHLGGAAGGRVVLRHLAAELDLVALLVEVGSRVLQRDDARVALEVGDRHVVLHADQGGRAVCADHGGGDLGHVLDAGQLLLGGLEVGRVDGARVGVDDDPGVGAGERRELLPEHVVGALAAGVRDDVVVVEAAAVRRGQAEDDDCGRRPGGDHPPGVAGGEATEAVEEAGHRVLLR